MASVFSYDPDPPRVSSPWSRQGAAAVETSQKDKSRACVNNDSQIPIASKTAPTKLSSLPNSVVLETTPHTSVVPGGDGYGIIERRRNDGLDETTVTHLEAEPQDGPTEYKLHLLLRPRSFSPAVSTPKKQQQQQQQSCTQQHHYPSPAVQSSNTSRQHRLEQLTTQLLWRLQQSSPYHSSSATNVILPTLPDTTTEELRPPQRPAKLLPGLEESKGALYEIGVADDGTFVGLTQDEMDESLNNLRAMAASLGCSVQVLRMVNIDEQQWLEHEDDSRLTSNVRTVKLFVAEAYVKPELQSGDSSTAPQAHSQSVTVSSTSKRHDVLSNSPVEQIRISLTGATTSGKSSLLGTLSTSTLDNARGKSRLSLLKHRHEIASGITSSVVQELIGYRDNPSHNLVSVVNYATGNISSWTDIHASSATERLAFISDSAGHPRYRRTTVRSLMSWAPHWTLLCIAANSESQQLPSEGSHSGKIEMPHFMGTTAHLSMAHLDVCLRLHLPLIIVITKFDVATKSGFRQILSTVLTVLKAAGRQPLMLSNDVGVASDAELQDIPEKDVEEAQKLAASLAVNYRLTVPILFTSAVSGTGVRKLHAMLRYLPFTSTELSNDSNESNVPRTLFHIDDVFNFSPSKTAEVMNSGNDQLSPGSVVSGYLEHGEIFVGDELTLGPFSQSVVDASFDTSTIHQSVHDDQFLMPRSFNDAINKATSSPKVKVVPLEREWRRVTVVSIRNLRLPVRKLERDQVGTLGVVPVDSRFAERRQLPIRKGQVLVSGETDPDAVHTFTAVFDIEEASSVVVGSFVVVYCASVRASAKVIAVALGKRSNRSTSVSPRRGQIDDSTNDDFGDTNSDDDTFGFHMDDDNDDNDDGDEKAPEYESSTSRYRAFDSENERGREEQAEGILVTFQLVTHREWLEIGSTVFIMTGGGGAVASTHSASERGVKSPGGLEGFVGTIVAKFG